MRPRSKTAAFSAALCIAALALCPTASAEPSAQEKETARSLMDEGDKLAAKKDWKGALRSYKAAHDIMMVPTTGVELGRAQAAVGQLVEARDTWLSVLRMPAKPSEPGAFGVARKEAESLATQLSPRIPSVRITRIDGPSDGKADVTIDGVALAPAALALPIKLNPGSHAIAARRDGFDPNEVKVTIGEGENRDVTLTLVAKRAATPTPSAVPAPSAPPPSDTPPPPVSERPTRHPLVVPGFIAAGVGVTVGSIFGALSLSKASSVKDQCRDDKSCPPAAQSDIDATKRFATFSNVGFGIGIVGAAVGVVGLVLGPKSGETAVAVSPSGLSFRRSF